MTGKEKKYRLHKLTALIDSEQPLCICIDGSRVKVFSKMYRNRRKLVPIELEEMERLYLWHIECPTCGERSLPLSPTTGYWDALPVIYVCRSYNCQNKTENKICVSCQEMKREEWYG